MLVLLCVGREGLTLEAYISIPACLRDHTAIACALAVRVKPREKNHAVIALGLEKVWKATSE